jgi:flagellar secretion chaperone FliS
MESLVPMSSALQIRVSAPNTARPVRKAGPAARGLAGMLLEGVRERVAAARDHLQAGNDSEREAIVQSALMLLEELRTDLDLFNGGAVAANLHDLYEYMGRRLGACLANDRRSEGDPQRADFRDRFPRIAGYYGRETIAERCRCGSAAAGEHSADRLPGVADLQNGLAALDEVSHLLEALHSAWVFLTAEARSASRN